MVTQRNAEERLRYGIVKIAAELGIDINLVASSIQNLSKNELIDKFCELKDLRLKKENMRLIDFVIG